jgi:hypothetical protein
MRMLHPTVKGKQPAICSENLHTPTPPLADYDQLPVNWMDIERNPTRTEKLSRSRTVTVAKRSQILTPSSENQDAMILVIRDVYRIIDSTDSNSNRLIHSTHWQKVRNDPALVHKVLVVYINTMIMPVHHVDMSLTVHSNALRLPDSLIQLPHFNPGAVQDNNHVSRMTR